MYNIFPYTILTFSKMDDPEVPFQKFNPVPCSQAKPMETAVDAAAPEELKKDWLFTGLQVLKREWWGTYVPQS